MFGVFVGAPGREVSGPRETGGKTHATGSLRRGRHRCGGRAKPSIGRSGYTWHVGNGDNLGNTQGNSMFFKLGPFPREFGHGEPGFVAGDVLGWALW